MILYLPSAVSHSKSIDEFDPTPLESPNALVDQLELGWPSLWKSNLALGLFVKLSPCPWIESQNFSFWAPKFFDDDEIDQ